MVRIATRLALVVLALAGCTTAGPEPGTQLGAAHSWNGYHWARTGNQLPAFKVPLVDSVASTSASDWNAMLQTVANDWSGASVLDTVVVAGTVSNSCKPIAGKLRACNRKYGYNGWLGMAQIYISGKHITQATAKVNDSYFGSGSYNNANAKRHVLCQEVGHCLGLDHQHVGDEGGGDSCMNDSGSSLFLAATVDPNSHDFAELGDIYGHDDGFTTLAPTAAAGVASAEDDTDFGTEMPSGQPGHKLFAKPLGQDKWLLTWVTLAVGPGPAR